MHDQPFLRRKLYPNPLDKGLGQDDTSEEVHALPFISSQCLVLCTRSAARTECLLVERERLLPGTGVRASPGQASSSSLGATSGYDAFTGGSRTGAKRDGLAAVLTRGHISIET